MVTLVYPWWYFQTCTIYGPKRSEHTISPKAINSSVVLLVFKMSMGMAYRIGVPPLFCPYIFNSNVASTIYFTISETVDPVFSSIHITFGLGYALILHWSCNGSPYFTSLAGSPINVTVGALFSALSSKTFQGNI